MQLANIVLRGLAAGMAVIPFLLMPAASLCAQTLVDLAHADRLKYESEYDYLYYVTTRNLPREQRERMARILAFTCASLSSSTLLDRQIPVEVEPTLYRINTRDLGWEKVLPKALKANYPYQFEQGKNPLVFRADWFVQFAMDQTKSKELYFELLFGKNVETLEEFLGFVGAKDSTEFTFGHIEANSRVAVNKVRILTTVPTLQRTDTWITFDYEEINAKTDPLENLTRGIRDGQHDHDATEVIAGLPKSLPGTGETGALQVYGLFNGQGQVQEVAPTNIVIDNTNTRGVEIINPLSCVACHVEGLRPPSTNALREYLRSGAEAYINDYEAQKEVDRFHLTAIEKWIVRANEDYEIAVKACNGYTAAENSAAFIAVIREYDRPLSIEDAARELYVSPEELRNALGYWTSAKKKMSARLASLAHGGTINRESWEGAYREALFILHTWRTSQ